MRRAQRPTLVPAVAGGANAALGHAGNPVRTARFLSHVQGQAAGFVASIVSEEHRAEAESRRATGLPASGRGPVPRFSEPGDSLAARAGPAGRRRRQAVPR